MRKLKIYLDTSVISYLRQEDAPEKMMDTQEFWKDVMAGEYDVYLSDITIQEIGNCSQPLRGQLFEHLNEIEYSLVSLTDDIKALAEFIISSGILTRKSYFDCLHIASAVIGECDYIVSWNFSHMVNVRIINGVRAVNMLKGYRMIDIVPPPMLKGGK